MQNVRFGAHGAILNVDCFLGAESVRGGEMEADIVKVRFPANLPSLILEFA
jgi:hypothetical protein